MGRQGQGGEQKAGHSSIALLQERFRQLQRAREMREERELRRVLAAETRRAGHHQQQQQQQQQQVLQPSWFFHPDLVRAPSRPVHRSFQCAEGLDSTSLWQAGGCMGGSFPEDKEVDTSLHL